MSMLSEFYQFLWSLFQEGEALSEDEVHRRLVDEGYGDVSAYDVREAVALMYDEGDVFTNQQASVLEAYTGGNVVDQSFNAGDIGSITNSPTTTVGPTSVGGHHGGGADYVPPVTGGGDDGGDQPDGGGQPPKDPVEYPEPPPMDPADGQTPLDAAVQQIVYVNNITNNTTNTTVNDNDVFEDNDTVVDSSVNQTILAGGDVSQDFDTQTISGDVDGVVAGDNADLRGAAVGDGNTVFNDSDGNVIGDGNNVANHSPGSAVGDGASNANIGVAAGPVAVGGGDAIDASHGGAVSGDGSGDAIVNHGQFATDGGQNIAANESQVATGGGDNLAAAEGPIISNEGGDQLISAEGGGDVMKAGGDIDNVENHGGVVATDGDASGVVNSAVGAAAFGEGAEADQTIIADNHIDDSVIQGDDGHAVNLVHEETDVDALAVNESTLIGAGLSTDGDASGVVDITGIEVEVPEDDSAAALTADS